MNDHPLPEIDPDESTIEDFELTATDLEAAGPPHPVNWNLLSADDLEAEWLELNRKFSAAWPNLTERRDPLPEAKERDGESGKLAKYFSEEPGEGD